MTTETCPHCGAERHAKYAGIYACGTAMESQRYLHRYCLQRKITQQAAEIERLRKELSRIYVHSRDGTNGECEYCNWSSDTAFDALKEVK